MIEWNAVASIEYLEKLLESKWNAVANIEYLEKLFENSFLNITFMKPQNIKSIR